jgi:hypothetical protein
VVYLFYHQYYKFWAVGKVVGAAPFIMACKSAVFSPDLITPSSPWTIFTANTGNGGGIDDKISNTVIHASCPPRTPAPTPVKRERIRGVEYTWSGKNSQKKTPKTAGAGVKACMGLTAKGLPTTDEYQQIGMKKPAPFDKELLLGCQGTYAIQSQMQAGRPVYMLTEGKYSADQVAASYSRNYKLLTTGGASRTREAPDFLSPSGGSIDHPTRRRLGVRKKQQCGGDGGGVSFLFYYERYKVWAIGTRVGSPPLLMVCADSGYSPDKLKAGCWQASGGKKDGGTFHPIPSFGLECNSASGTAGDQQARQHKALLQPIAKQVGDHKGRNVGAEGKVRVPVCDTVRFKGLGTPDDAGFGCLGHYHVQRQMEDSHPVWMWLNQGAQCGYTAGAVFLYYKSFWSQEDQRDYGDAGDNGGQWVVAHEVGGSGPYHLILKSKSPVPNSDPGLSGHVSGVWEAGVYTKRTEAEKEAAHGRGGKKRRQPKARFAPSPTLLCMCPAPTPVPHRSITPPRIITAYPTGTPTAPPVIPTTAPTNFDAALSTQQMHLGRWSKAAVARRKEQANRMRSGARIGDMRHIFLIGSIGAVILLVLVTMVSRW